MRHPSPRAYGSAIWLWNDLVPSIDRVLTAGTGQRIAREKFAARLGGHDLARLAEAGVGAGHAPSLSAWVADAIRAKVRARADLVADLEELERREPTSPEVVASMARALGLPRTAVAKVIKGGDLTVD